MKKALIFVLIAECWITAGQICFKKSANNLSTDTISQKTWVTMILEVILRSPIIWIGAASMLLGMMFWFAALSNGELSYVYLLGSIQYIIALIASHFFLHERIDSNKLIGTLLITLGIILTAIS